MSDCSQRDAYLDRRLSSSEARSFHAHARECPACREAVSDWQGVVDGMAEVMAARDPTASVLHSPSEVLAAAEGRDRRWRWKPLIWVPVSVTAVLLMVAVITQLDHDLELTVEHTGDGVVEREGSAVVASAKETQLIARVGSDVVGMAPRTRVRVARATRRRVHLVLQEGVAAFSVDRTTKRREFEVDALGWAKIRVTGTRFSVAVTSTGAEVVVESGALDVETRHGRLSGLSAGEMAKISAGLPPVRASAPAPARKRVVGLLRPSEVAPDAAVAPVGGEPRETTATDEPPPPSPSTPDDSRPRQPPYARWAEAIGSGDCATVRAQIVRRTRRAPRDVEALSLLGDCERKEGNFRAAVAAYRRVTNQEDSRFADRARYLAAEILEAELDDPKGALGLLRAFLASERSARGLRATARLRLGQILLRLGRPAEAQVELEEVVRSHPRSQAAKAAERALADLP